MGIAAIGETGAQMLRHQAFQGGAVNIFRPIQRAGRTKSTKDAGIKKIEFLMGDQSPASSPCEYRDFKGQENISG